MEIKYVGKKHGYCITSFVKKSENEIFVQFDNTNIDSYTLCDVSIHESSYKNSKFKWDGDIFDNNNNLLHKIDTDKKVLLDNFFEIDSGIFILMGQIFETRYGIISLFVTLSVYNKWLSIKNNNKLNR